MHIWEFYLHKCIRDIPSIFYHSVWIQYSNHANHLASLTRENTVAPLLCFLPTVGKKFGQIQLSCSFTSCLYILYRQKGWTKHTRTVRYIQHTMIFHCFISHKRISEKVEWIIFLFLVSLDLEKGKRYLVTLFYFYYGTLKRKAKGWYIHGPQAFIDHSLYSFIYVICVNYRSRIKRIKMILCGFRNWNVFNIRKIDFTWNDNLDSCVILVSSSIVLVSIL